MTPPESLPDGLEAAAGTGSRLTALRVLRAPLRRGTRALLGVTARKCARVTRRVTERGGEGVPGVGVAVSRARWVAVPGGESAVTGRGLPERPSARQPPGNPRGGPASPWATSPIGRLVPAHGGTAVHDR